MEKGNPRDASMIIVLSILIVPVILGYLWTLVKNWLEGIDSSADIANTYKYNNEYRDNHSGKYKDRKTRTYTEDKQTDRERPPNASFFCRVDGKETFIEGPYEEKFLTKYESLKWSYKKRRRELKKIVIKS